MNSQDSLVDVLAVLWKWRKKIIWTTAAVAIGSIILSLTLSNYYKSTTVFFAASTDINKPEQVFGLTNKATRFYGDDFDNDRLLTVASSSELIQFLLDSFKIAAHYDMKTDTPKRQFKLEKKFRSNLEVLKTKFDAISLSFEDKEPEYAAAITNAARNQIGHITLNLLKSSQAQRRQLYEGSIQKKTTELAIIEDSLQSLRKRYNIFDLESQGELLSTIATQTESELAGTRAALAKFKTMSRQRDTVQILTARVANLENKLQSVLGNEGNAMFSLKLLREGMAATEILNNQQERLSQQLDAEKEKLRQINTVYASNAPTIILAEKGEIPKIKSRPKRSILVLAATLAAFIFSALGALMFENIGKIDLKRIKGA